MTVQQAEKIINSTIPEYGTESIDFEQSAGRVLAEDIIADRDLPPCNRVTMDGIAIKYASLEHNKSFHIRGTQAAGDEPTNNICGDECIEIMTGAALPASADTIIRYEDLDIKNGMATVLSTITREGQNIHYKGSDKKQGEIIVAAASIITPAVISVAASVGKTLLVVKKHPRIIIIATGDEIIEPSCIPSAYQVRSSNVYLIKSALAEKKILSDTCHLRDDHSQIKTELQRCIKQYDVLIITGGVSMGKFDYIPSILESLSVKKQFHKVDQRPGKPFWFGVHNEGALVFAFPGNPVSACLCLYRYFFPWFKACMGSVNTQEYAVLKEDVAFTPSLTFFMQVKLELREDGLLLATPLIINGSGDFTSLTNTDGFLELPAERERFVKGEVFTVFSF